MGTPMAEPAEWMTDCTGSGSAPVAAAAVPADNAPTTTTTAAAWGTRQARDRRRRATDRAGAVSLRAMAGTVGEPQPDDAGATPSFTTPISIATRS